MDFGKHIAFCHWDLTWRRYCLCVRYTLSKGTTPDYNDHVWRMHEVPLSVGLAMSAKFFPVWTFTSINTLFFSRVVSLLDHPCWLISRTGSQYVAVFSVEALTVVCGTRYIGYVDRPSVSPPCGQTRGTARINCQHEPHTLGVDLQPGKCRPGKISRTVSILPLTLNMTVMCTSGVMAPPPEISTQDVLPLATVVSTVKAVSESMPFVVPLAPIVEQSGRRPRSFRPAGCRNHSSLFRCSDCHLRCRGEQRMIVAALFARPCSGGTFAGSSG